MKIKFTQEQIDNPYGRVRKIGDIYQDIIDRQDEEINKWFTSYLAVAKEINNLKFSLVTLVIAFIAWLVFHYTTAH